MGTNYYVTDGEKPCCECGHTVPNKVHIGKTSAGWRFLAWAGPGRPRTWEALREVLRHRAVVLDDYGGVLTGEDLIRAIEARAGLKGHFTYSQPWDWSDGPADFTEAVFR